MTEQDQDAVLGGIMRQYKGQRDLAVKLRAEAKRLGEQLMALGQALNDAPRICGISWPHNFASACSRTPSGEGRITRSTTLEGSR